MVNINDSMYIYVRIVYIKSMVLDDRFLPMQSSDQYIYILNDMFSNI